MYDFSADWFSPHIPTFRRLLAGLKDQPCRLLEVGAYEGRSTTWLIDNIATHPLARIDIVDIRENPKLSANLVATRHPEKATFHLGASCAVLRKLPLDNYDFIYIDGSHSTVSTLEDAVHAFRLARAGGIIAFDDYLWDDRDPNQAGRPREAIDAFLKIYAGHIELLHRRRQVWIRIRTGAAPANRPVAAAVSDWFFYQIHRFRPRARWSALRQWLRA